MADNRDPSDAAETGSLWRLAAMRQLMLLTFFGFTSFFVTLSALPSFAALGGVGVGVAGTVTTAMLLCTVAVQMMVPAAVHRFGTAAVLVCGLVLLGAPGPLYLLSQQLWWLVLVSLLRGAGFAVLTVLGASTTARIAPPGRRGESIGLYGLSVAVPSLVAVPAGVALTLDGRFAWVALASMSPLLALPVVRPLTRRAGVGVGSMASRPSKVTRRELIGVALPSVMLLVVTLAGGGFVTFLPIERAEGSVAVVALAVYGVCAALARWGAGLLADRIGTGLVLPLSLLLSAFGMLGVAAGLVVGDAAGAAVLTAVSAVVLVIGYGATQNLTLLEAFARTHRHDVASAVWNVCFDLGTAIGAFAVGLVAAAGTGIPGAFVVCAVVVLAALPLVAILRAPDQASRR
jgi:predicted MFS family arabinose efflux permease